MEKVNWKVEGMTCSNCALTIGKYLEKQGIHNVQVNLAGGELQFDLAEPAQGPALQQGIESLGYVVNSNGESPEPARKKMNRFLRYVLICAPFTLLLMLPMIPALRNSWLNLPWVQLVLCLPVYITGMHFFGRSAIRSLRHGLPNMNVLIALGATAAFVYSLAGTLLLQGIQYQFYETAAAIITLVFLGNYLEDASIHSTQRALNQLARSQQVMANMIAFDDKHQEQIFPIHNSQLRSGDLVLIRSGEQVPADCKILWGEATLNEAIITGESLPVTRQAKDRLIGGSLVVDGTVKAQVMAAARDSVLANIIDLVKRAQSEKPPMQLLADRISAIFVPVVLAIAAGTLLVNYLALDNFREALMRSIAVLVIACPCAMGLATPAAIAVGLGRAARQGILFRNARSLELFRNIEQVVFDKTGTLSTGDFEISRYEVLDPSMTDEAFRQLVYSMEKYSNHPIAQSITRAWKTRNPTHWARVNESKGRGIRVETQSGDWYEAGSIATVADQTGDDSHNVYISRNGVWIGWIDVRDEIRPEVGVVLNYLRARNIRTYLLSGDRLARTRALGERLGIDEVIAEQSPEQKLEVIARLNAQHPTAMVGDGINDAPALAKASIGISLSDASQVAMQTADVVLMNQGLKALPTALGLGRHTYLTIRQNLFWAFFYNVIAIPVAAFGFLTPAVGALVMALSDVVLAINSIRLFVKKVT